MKTKEYYISKFKSFASINNRLRLVYPEHAIYLNTKPYNKIIAYLLGDEGSSFDEFEKGMHSILANTTSFDEVTNNEQKDITIVIRYHIRNLCRDCNSSVYKNFKKNKKEHDDMA